MRPVTNTFVRVSGRERGAKSEACERGDRHDRDDGRHREKKAYDEPRRPAWDPGFKPKCQFLKQRKDAVLDEGPHGSRASLSWTACSMPLGRHRAGRGSKVVNHPTGDKTADSLH